ncbi:MAG TPA: glycoside hydrolase family 25 protein [Candidatus Limnocylindrales bacterium]|jgi:GH25 family lysozyme M1 (1,4-beta-N-acetylmuramidase)
MLAFLAAMVPASALGATSATARCDGAALRTRPSATATRVARVGAGTRIVSTTVVTGGKWHVRCAGKTATGRTWWKIAIVGSKSSSARYHRRYVYAAATLFKAIPVKLQAACTGARLRTAPKASARTKTQLRNGARVTGTWIVTGDRWSFNCGGAQSGHTWYRITSIDGVSVRQLYGIPAVYAARGLLKSASSIVIPPPPDTSGYIEGIDVSHYQGTIDWARVAAAGKRFAFMKASDSTDYVDPTYVTNRAQAKLQGLKVGAYHFARPDATPGDAIAEADHFIAAAGWGGGDLVPVLDLETTGGLNVANLQAWVSAFLGRIYDRTGVKAMIYTSPSFWTNKMGDTQAFAAAGYKSLWIAHWTTNPSATVPASNWAGNGWTFWQYTSDGAVPGILGRVDLDRYNRADFGPVLLR